MRVLTFSTTFVWNIFHSRKNRARYDQKCLLVFVQSTRYYWKILKKIRPMETELFPADRWTDGRT
jgi:hypothetical protein